MPQDRAVRHRVIQSARAVFSERGVEATLDDVARHAGVGVGTVYRRFPAKSALLDAATRRAPRERSGS
ncbi:TetR family transcriptional regulator [Streptomyces sp. SID5914]|nr:helix-turn-helix domain-containing protein [Streptomyces sp. SID5914]MZG12708.1 TetR family transcriptional regulator [Streptomyces sp. SID5914]